MHPYSVDSRRFPSIAYYVAASAIVLTLGLRILLQFFHVNPGTITYLPSAFALYAALYGIFDRFLWKWRVVQWLGIVTTPDVSGHWQGNLRSSHSNYLIDHEVLVRVHQTWTNIRLTLDGERSISLSTMACIATVSPSEYELRWEYLAEAKRPDENELFNHRGVTTLRFQTSGSKVLPIIKGSYYTQQGRDSNGTIILERVS